MPSTSVADTGPADSAAPDAVRSRDADATRRLLLHAARRRFARDGYSGTTVRDIAQDAGVNVALINRYFTSKEGLFESCIRRAGEELGDRAVGEASTAQLVRSLVSQVRASPSGERQLLLLLLLRSSGDARAEEIRRGILESFARSMASAMGWSEGIEDSSALLLRAQVALSAALGIVLLRSSSGVEPLTTADDEDLTGPLEDLFAALLVPPSM